MVWHGYTCRPMKKTTIRLVLAGCSFMCGFAVFAYAQNHAAKTGSPLLLVANQHDHNLSLIDPAAGKQVATVPADGVTGHEVAESPDGKTAAIIPISKNTQRIAISPDDSMVFTADQAKPQLAVIDTATNRVKTWVPLPAMGYGTAPTPDGRWLLVALRTSKQVAVVDLKT